MRIRYECKCRDECTCDFLTKFEHKLKKGVKSTVVSVFCNETLFPAINIVDLIIWYIPNVNHLILHGVDYYDLPILCEKFQQLKLTRLNIRCYRHQSYCYEDDTIFPNVDDLNLPPNLISFKFQYFDDPCSSHPIYTTKHIFKYPPTLRTLHLFKMAWPQPHELEQMGNLTNLELSSFCSYKHQLKFPQSLKKFTIAGIDRGNVAFNQKRQYDIPTGCKLTLKFDASDKSCYASDSDPDSDKEINEFRNRKDYPEQEFIENRRHISVLESFTNQVQTLHLSTQLSYNSVPNIIKECNKLQVLIIHIKGKYKEGVWDAIKNHPSLRVLIVKITSRNESEYLKFLQTLSQILNENVKLYILRFYNTPLTIEQIENVVKCKVIYKMFGYY